MSWHALRLAQTGPGKRVAVVGAGALGLLAVAGARRMGGEDVAIEARHRIPAGRPPSNWALRSAPTACTRWSSRPPVRAESLARCAELVAPGGTIVVLGVHFGPVQIDWMPVFHKEARIIPSLGYCGNGGSDGRPGNGRRRGDARRGPGDPGALITHRFPLEDAVHAFEVAGDRSTGAIRVVIET